MHSAQTHTHTTPPLTRTDGAARLVGSGLGLGLGLGSGLGSLLGLGSVSRSGLGYVSRGLKAVILTLTLTLTLTRPPLQQEKTTTTRKWRAPRGLKCSVLFGNRRFSWPSY